MEEKYHLVPESLLEGWAVDGRVTVFDREARSSYVTSIKRAAKEGGFYQLEDPIEPLAVELAQYEEQVARYPLLAEITEHSEGEVRLKAGGVERLLSAIEGEARTATRSILDGDFPPNGDTRFWLSVFMGLQHARGRRFIATGDALTDFWARLQMDGLTRDHVRTWLKNQGRPSGNTAVTAFIEELRTNPPDVRMAKNFRLGFMLKTALEQLAPVIFSKTWVLLSFETPDVVLSDEPLALWVRRDRTGESIGLGNADCVFMPLDASHALKLLAPGAAEPEAMHVGSPARLRNINLAVASQAERWIFWRPDRTPLSGVEVPGPPEMAFETVASDDGGEIVRFYRAPPDAQ